MHVCVCFFFFLLQGYNKPRAYIATQGPLPHTFADFWRMIWEQGSIVIIMITNLMERGRRKCDMYWPEEGTETYGSVTVKHINTFSRAHYTVRMLSLKNIKNKKVSLLMLIQINEFYCLKIFSLFPLKTNELCLWGICGQWRPRSDCTNVQSDQGLHCPLVGSWTL